MTTEINEKITAELHQAQMLKEIADSISGSGLRYEILRIETLRFFSEKHVKMAQKLAGELAIRLVD